MFSLKKIAAIILLAKAFFVSAQIPFGHEKAIYKDSSIYVSWATGCTVHRGLQNIADSTSGYATDGDSTDALGKADGVGVVSLGDGGYAILTFDKPIVNGSGYDFAVFENGFQLNVDSLFFLELAFVEVSSDGVNYFRFPSSSITDTVNQIGNGDGINPKWLYNLAGKYMINYGTPFDLDELKNISGLNVNHITHVKVIDVVGNLENTYARRDSANRKVNDPWPTPFPSCGFDLDAVGVINQSGKSAVNDISLINSGIKIYPVPLINGSELTITNENSELFDKLEIIDISGKIILMQPFTNNQLTTSLRNLKKGIYILKISAEQEIIYRKINID